MIPNRELNANEKASALASLINPNGQFYFLGITATDILNEASSTYNCHAYAWHLREGNTNNVWINNVYGNPDLEGCFATTNNIDTYWSNTLGCFVEVLEYQAEKIHYYCGDHSAVKSYVAGKYESKWGQLPVVKHFPNQVPYSHPERRRYYAKPYISGPSQICNQETYSVNYLPSCDSINWSVSQENIVSLQKNGNDVILTRTGVGTVVLTANILLNNVSIATLTKTITAYGSISLGLSSYTNLLMLDNYGQYFKMLPMVDAWRYGGSLTVSSFATNYTWSNQGSSSFTSWTPNGATVTVYAKNPNSNISLKCTASNPCYSESKTYYFTTSDITIENVILTPNPASEFTVVDFTEELTSEFGTITTESTADAEEYEIQLYSSYGLVKSIQTNQKNYQLSLSGIPAGFYYIHVLKNGKTYRKQLIVK